MNFGADRNRTSGRPRPWRVGAWLLAERLAWAGGILGLAVWAVLTAAGAAGAREEMHRFAALRERERASQSTPDQRLWSPERVRAWRETLSRQAPEPLAVLRVPRLGIEVPVLEGTDDWTLNRAVGHIADTAAPG